MLIKSFLYLWLIITSLPALAETRLPEIPSKSQPLSVQLQTEFFRTQANYITFGQYADLPNNDFFQYVSFRPTVSYSPFQNYINFSLFANSFFASSKNENKEYLLPFQVSSVGVGASFYHKIQTLFIGLELRGGVPLYKGFQNPQEIVVGDGAYFAEPGLWLIFQPSKIFYIYNHTAFRWRSAGLSSLLFASLGGVVESEFISFGLSLDSFFSLLIHDHFTSQASRRLNILKTANAGSHKFYSVNPSVLSGTAWAEFKFDPLFTTLYVNLDTMGENYAKGFSVGLMTKFQWSMKSSFIDKKRKNKTYLDFEGWEEEEERTQNKVQKQKKSSYFEEEDDSSLFQDDPPDTNQDMNQELKDELNLLTE